MANFTIPAPNLGPTYAITGVGTSEITDDSVANTDLANMAEATVKGRAAGAGTGDPTDLTAAQLATLLGTNVVNDTAYDATSWNGVTTVAPSKNAVRDIFETAVTSADINQIVVLTQAAYDALTPTADTLYVIVG